MAGDPAGMTRWRRSDWTALVPAGLLVSFLVLPQRLQNDDFVRARALESLREGDVPNSLEFQYSLIQPLLALPFNVVLERAGLGVTALTLIAWSWVAASSAIVWWLLRRERGGWYASNVVVLCLVSLTAASVVGFSGDVFSMAAISAGVLLAYLGRSRGGRATGWALTVLAAANTPALGVAITAIAITTTLQRRRVRYLLAPLAAFIAIVGEATLVEGSLAFGKYTSQGNRGEVAHLPWGEVVRFGWPLWSGVLAILFSFGRGLIFFLPLWVAGPPPGKEPPDELERAELALWIGVAVLVPFYATWWAWYAGVSFGPRFFLLGTVPTAMAAVRVLSNRSTTVVRLAVVSAAVGFSAWIAITAVSFGQSETAFVTCSTGGSWDLFALCLYTPEYSNIWIPIWADDPFVRRSGPFIVAVLVAVALVVGRPVARVADAGRRRLVRATSQLRSDWRF